MKLIKLLWVLPVAAISLALVQRNSLNDLIQPGATLEKLADGFLFTEGPSADKDGNVYFTDQPNDRIMIWSISGKLSTFMQPCGRSNGLSFDKEGYLWACADEKNELWRIAPDKKVQVMPSKYDDKILNGPNDVWISPEGRVYFTDPFYKRTWWDHSTMAQDAQAVYFLDAAHASIRRVTEDLVTPNGIVGTPDGKKLYVADLKDKKTWSYTINNDGTLSDKKLFCEMGSDGMTLDTKGNLYLTGKGVTVFDSKGNLKGNIEVPENWCANVCFGDKDLKSLYITATKGLYRIRMKVRGTAG